MTHTLRRAGIVFAGTAALTAGLIGGGASADTTYVHLTGHVFLADGTPLANVIVRGGGNGVGTNNVGSYYLSVPRDETFRLEIQTPDGSQKPTGVPQYFELRWPSVSFTADTAVDFTLPPVVEQTFRVRTAIGDPVSNGGIGMDVPDLADPGGSGTGLARPEVRQLVGAPSDGTALVFADERLVGLNAHGWLSTGVSPGPTAGTNLTTDLSPTAVGGGQDVVAQLPATGTVRATVTTSDGAPVKNWSVVISTRHGSTYGEVRDSGILRMDVERGNWQVELSGPGSGRVLPEWRMSTGATVYAKNSWSLTLPEVVDQPIRVHKADGTPAAGAYIDSPFDNVDSVPLSTGGWSGATFNGSPAQLEQRIRGIANDKGRALLPTFIDAELPVMTAALQPYWDDRSWWIHRQFSIQHLADPKPTNVTLPATTWVQGDVHNGRPYSYQELSSNGPGVSASSTLYDSYRLPMASNGSHLTLAGESTSGTIGCPVPYSYRISLPFSSDRDRIHADLELPKVATVDARFVTASGRTARGMYTIATEGSEPADRAAILSGQAKAQTRHDIKSQWFGGAIGARSCFLPDRDVERLVVREQTISGLSAPVAIIKHLSVERSRQIKVTVGTPGNPVIQ